RVLGFAFSLSRAKRTVRQAESSSSLIERVSWNQASARSVSQDVENCSAMSLSTSPIRRLMLSTYLEACRCRRGGITARLTTTPTITPRATSRSEEHTSELQSRFDLVCRLLLEKKKKNNKAAALS